MARPKSTGLDYFPHDTDATTDEKIEALRNLYNNDGYAFYFILLERIYRTPNCELLVSDAETNQKLNRNSTETRQIDAEMLQILSKKVEVTEEKFKLMLQTALKWGCFSQKDYNDRGVLTSNGIKKRIRPVLEKRLKMREMYKSKANKIVSDAETNQKLNRNSTETRQRKEKKSKEKYSKETKEERYIYDFWNNLGIIKHKSINGFHATIKSVLKTYAQQDITDAMKNYNTILKSDDYYWTHYWTLKEFLMRGIDKFLTENKPMKNYKNRNNDNDKKNEGKRYDSAVSREGNAGYSENTKEKTAADTTKGNEFDKLTTVIEL